jgi:hypothetical protein
MEIQNSLIREIIEDYLQKYSILESISLEKFNFKVDEKKYFYYWSNQLYDFLDPIDDQTYIFLLKKLYREPSVLFHIFSNKIVIDLFSSQQKVKNLERYNETINLNWAVNLKKELDHLTN